MANPAKLLLYIATTLDGYIASTDGKIDWLTSFDTDDQDNGYLSFYSTIEALIMGAATYEQVLGFGDWPYPGRLCYVLTNRTLAPDRDHILFVSSLEAILEDIHQKGLQRVWIVGGGQSASLFMAAGLVDDYILTLIPIILGSGISLYQTVPQQTLRLIKTVTYASGAVELHYRRQ